MTDRGSVGLTDSPALLEVSAPVVLAMHGISKAFAGVTALSDVSLEVQAGEVHALLGENGAGKSTLMNIAAGTILPDAGSLAVDGEPVATMTPAISTELGVAMVHQHPAVMPDLTIEENLRIALPESFFAGDEPANRKLTALLDDVGLEVHLKDRVELLTVAQRHLLEVAKALAIRPKILILDEPTAPLGKEPVDLLFDRVRRVVARGTAVVYITHRLAEVRELANRVTVLRDGQVRGTVTVDSVSDRELLAMIVGRQLDSTFPDKPTLSANVTADLNLSHLSGSGFHDVSLSARRGEIIGIAGVVGNGQADLMRALAGLEGFSGDVRVSGDQLRSSDLLQRAVFMPSDRQREALMLSLTVRENAAIGALTRFRRGRLLSRKRELGLVADTLQSLAVKAGSLDSAMSSLSGGNQQKVVMARAMLAEPALVVADEPTQGVDVGARAEIYRILREVSASGIPVVVNSSDAKELEGLCDQVLVMSRGNLVETLTGDEITEERIVNAAVSSTAHTVEVDNRELRKRTSAPIRRFLSGDYAPAMLLLAVIIALGAYVYTHNSLYLSSFNLKTMFMLISALGFISVGQTIALLTGGIDLSVGPLAGFLVVVGSFFINDGKSAFSVTSGFVLMFVLALAAGLVNGTLIRYLKFTSIAATLTTYIALQGLSLFLRPHPAGYVNTSVANQITRTFGAIPLAFLILIAVTVVMEFVLRRRRWGWTIRAVGSQEESARSVGVRVNRTVVGGYIATSAFTSLGAVMLLTQIGVGDATQGVGYTLTSITAVVLGGTSLLGGRGTFIGTLLGSVLLIQVLNATTFLNLSSMWQYYFQGLLILAAAVLYSLARARRDNVSSHRLATGRRWLFKSGEAEQTAYGAAPAGSGGRSPEYGTNGSSDSRL